MKNSLLALFLSVCSTSAFAQAIEINDLNRRNFTGIKTNVNKDIFYTGYLLTSSNAETDSVALKLYNRDLREMGILGLSVPKKSQLISYTFTNEFVVLLLGNAEKKTRTTYVLNVQGEVVGKNTEENVTASMFEPANAPLMFSANPREFVMLQKNQDNGGYTLEAKDIDFKTKWTKTFNPNKGSWEIVQVLPSMDGLTILKKDLSTDGKYGFSIESVSLNDGSVLFNTPLSTGANGYPVFMQINDEMRIVTAGIFLKNGPCDTFDLLIPNRSLNQL